jgi:hypothetical protein
MKVRLPTAIVCLLLTASALLAQSPYQSSSDFAKYAMRLREDALLRVEPQVFVPTTAGTAISGKYPWKIGIYTTVFWVGEQPTVNNPVPNTSSSWDLHWAVSYGGYDDPGNRRGFIPARFTPQLNPFYIALPYNDVTHGSTKPEARYVIPWFRDSFVKEGQSVCRDRWVAIRNRSGKVCYAQWSDCGPFRTDHWQYVFGNERPKWNLNHGAGLDVSPAVHDYLHLSNTDVTDWQFVDVRDVPDRGPWAYYGENNHFVQQARRMATRVASNKAVPGTKAPGVREPTVFTPTTASAQDGPTVIMNSNGR